MPILVDAETRLVVQGLTGSEGRFHGLRNRSHGTNAEDGRAILAEAGRENIYAEATMLDGARRAVELAA